MRSSIIRYSELVAPLQVILTTALRLLPVKPKNAAKNFLLSAAGWTTEHTTAFVNIKESLAHSVTLAYPSDHLTTCVWTDASDEYWAGVVTQAEAAELQKPVLQQLHKPMAFVSGRFTGAQLKWPTVEKEGFAILQTLTRCSHILRRPRGFELFTDHRNLQFLFSNDPTIAQLKRQSADRLERWMIILRGFNFCIQHVDGEDNIVSDMMTRFGVVPRLRAEREQERDMAAARVSTRDRDGVATSRVLVTRARRQPASVRAVPLSPLHILSGLAMNLPVEPAVQQPVPVEPAVQQPVPVEPAVQQAVPVVQLFNN
jgi:hypothetical protein